MDDATNQPKLRRFDWAALEGAPAWLARKRKIPVKRAAALAGMSEDTFRKKYPELIKKVSRRLHLVELGKVLEIGNTPDETAIAFAEQHHGRRPNPTNRDASSESLTRRSE